MAIETPIWSSDGKTLSNVLLKGTNIYGTYNVVTNWWDGTPMDDTKLDEDLVYVKYQNKYLVRNAELGQVLQKDTMAEMRNLSKLEILFLRLGYYKHIQLNGYYIKNDTPKPIEYTLSNTTEIDDGGSVIIIEDIKLEHNFNGYVLDKYFGAKRNGSDETNVYLNIQKYIKRKGGGVIEFTKGNSIITQDFVLDGVYNVTYRGSGWDCKLTFSRAPQSISGFTKNVWVALECKNIIIENLFIDGGAQNYKTVSPWDIEGAYNAFYSKPRYNDAVSDVIIRGCYFTKVWSSIIGSYGSSGDAYPHFTTNNLTFVDNTINDIGFHGVGMNEFKNSYIARNKMFNIGLSIPDPTGVYGSGLGIDASAGCEDIIVEYNMIDGTGGGMKCETHVNPNDSSNVPSKRIRFLYNTVKNVYKGAFFNQFYGIKLNGIDCEATGNIIEEQQGWGIILANKAQGCKVSYNKVKGSVNGSGINIANGIRNTVNNNEVTNSQDGISIEGFGNKVLSNECYGNRRDGIRLISGDYAEISYNKCYDNVNYGIKAEIGASITQVLGLSCSFNECFDTRVDTARTQLRGIDLTNTKLINPSASNNNCYNNKTDDFQNRNALVRNKSVFNKTFILEAPAKPASTTGFVVGDICINTNMKNAGSELNYLIYGWVLMADNTWRDLRIPLDKATVGTTANRPTNVSNGFEYFDTTLKKPLYWDSNTSTWIPAILPASVSSEGTVKQSAYQADIAASDVAGVVAWINQFMSKYRTSGQGASS